MAQSYIKQGGQMVPFAVGSPNYNTFVSLGSLAQHGTVLLNSAIAANGQTTVAVTFQTPYSLTPSVSVTNLGTSSYSDFANPYVSSLTATGFTLGVRNLGSTAIAAGASFQWMANAGAVVDIPVALNYLANEQPTGKKWVDGKPVYCRTYEGVVTATSGTSHTLQFTAAGYIDSLISVSGYMKLLSNRTAALPYNDGTNRAAVYQNTITGVVTCISTCTEARTDAPYGITIEYTKV